MWSSSWKWNYKAYRLSHLSHRYARCWEWYFVPLESLLCFPLPFRLSHRIDTDVLLLLEIGEFFLPLALSAIVPFSRLLGDLSFLKFRGSGFVFLVAS